MKITNLETAYKAIENIKKKCPNTDIYVSDDHSFQWYFAVSGRIGSEQLWFDYYIYKTRDKVQFEESSCSIVRPKHFDIDN